jgi:hypothetical protein
MVLKINDKKILVSMVAYRERYLKESVQSCYSQAKNPENLIFSIISEQEDPSLHADLDFIPKNQIYYAKYDLSTYRGVLWSRVKTIELASKADYDYILYTGGHNRFVDSWDEKSINLNSELKSVAEKPIITIAGPTYIPTPSGEIEHTNEKNGYRPAINKDYIPGHGFPEQIDVPDNTPWAEDKYLQFSWVFADKRFVEEVPLDPDMNYHGEEIYTTIHAWAKGWRFFSTSEIFYYHDTEKKYEDEPLPRMTTHRPWGDMNKDAFWAQSDRSMLKLNRLLSGTLTGDYGNIPKEVVLNYCEFSGLDPKWCEYDEDYDKLPAERHAQFFKDKKPMMWTYNNEV